MDLVDETLYPALAEVVGAVLSAWPTHKKMLAKSLADRDRQLLQHSEILAAAVTRLAGAIDGGLSALAADYKFLCQDIILPEEMYFRRHGTYRLATFAEASQAVYSDRPFMTRYMNGLLVSQLMWVNHSRATQHYLETFLANLKPGADLLEVGPGHGLLLYLAGQSDKIARSSAWDVSLASLEASRRALQALGTRGLISFEQRDIFDEPLTDPDNEERFDAIVMSEVLEHLERPAQALRAIFGFCKPGGRVWINVPANSPAPDHLFLLRDPAEAERLVEDAGFAIIDAARFPMTGASLEQAIKHQLSISCIVVGERPMA